MELAASSEPGRAPQVDPGRLPDGLGWSIDDRLRHAGARKGRVLAVWQGKTLLAACSRQEQERAEGPSRLLVVVVGVA